MSNRLKMAIVHSIHHVTFVALVPAADCCRAGNRPRDGPPAPVGRLGRGKCSHSAHRVGRFKCSHFLRVAGSRLHDPSDGAGHAENAGGSNAAILPTGSAACPMAPGPPSPRGRPSECEPFREIIVAKLSQDLSAQRIYQDLAGSPGFTAGYDSVKRFVRKTGGAASSADAAPRMCAWSGSPGRLRHRRAGDRSRWQASQDARLPHRVVALSQGVQRGNVPPDDGRFYPLHGERLLAPRRRARDARDR